MLLIFELLLVLLLGVIFLLYGLLKELLLLLEAQVLVLLELQVAKV